MTHVSYQALLYVDWYLSYGMMIKAGIIFHWPVMSYSPVSMKVWKQCRIKVDVSSWRCIDINTTLILHCVPVSVNVSCCSKKVCQNEAKYIHLFTLLTNYANKFMSKCSALKDRRNIQLKSSYSNEFLHSVQMHKMISSCRLIFCIVYVNTVQISREYDIKCQHMILNLNFSMLNCD